MSETNFTPLTWWRENEMPKVTTIPTMLLRQDGGLANEGDMMAYGDTQRQVRLCDAVPDQNGQVTVQETFSVSPEQLGLHVRPETVVLELTREEAVAVLDFYKAAVARGNNVEPQATGVLDALRATAGGGRG